MATHPQVLESLYADIRRAPILAAYAREDEGNLFTAPALEGWAEKQGADLLGGWKARYFILNGSLLYYFRRKEDVDPLGFVMLEDVVTSAPGLTGPAVADAREAMARAAAATGDAAGAARHSAAAAFSRRASVSSDSAPGLSRFSSSFSSSLSLSPSSDALGLPPPYVGPAPAFSELECHVVGFNEGAAFTT